jgi:hypothetical protein
MSWLGSLVAGKEERDLQTKFYGGPINNKPTRTSTFAKKVRTLLDREVAAGNIERSDAFAVLRWEADRERDAIAARLETRNATVPKIHSGNLPEPKFKFLKKGN